MYSATLISSFKDDEKNNQKENKYKRSNKPKNRGGTHTHTHGFINLTGGVDKTVCAYHLVLLRCIAIISIIIIIIGIS